MTNLSLRRKILVVDGSTDSWFIVESNMFSFEKLNVYQASLDLVNDIYILTQDSQDWPKSEIFGLTGQIRRAAVSISLNIAGRRGFIKIEEFNKFYSRFTSQAMQISALKRSIQP